MSPKKLAGSFTLIIVFIALSKLVPTGVWAGQTGLQISPLAVEKELSPGESVTITLKVFNPLNEAQTIRIFSKDAIPSTSQGGLNFVDYSQERLSLTRWLDYPKENIKLEPHQEVKIKIGVDIPKNALAGSHLAAIFASPLESGSQLLFPGFNVQQKVAVGTLFLIKVLGQAENIEPYGGEIEDFEITNLRRVGPYPVLIDPPKFKVTFKNTGLFHQIVWGGLEIFDRSGHLKYTAHLPEHRVLPTARSLFQDQWANPTVLGSYKARATVVFGEKGEKQKTQEQSFIYVNLKAFFLILLGGTIALVFLGRRLKELLPHSQGRGPRRQPAALS